jgi:hypothetical protein
MLRLTRDIRWKDRPSGSAYAFPIAKPGTYRLPPIKRAAGGEVLDESGHTTSGVC